MTDAAVRRQYDRLARGYDQRWSRYITQTLTFLKSWAVRACQPGEDAVKSVAVDDFFPLRTCVYMAVNTGEIAAFADVDLSISPRTAGQHPSSSLLHTTNRELAKRRSRRDARATSAKPIPAPLSSKQFARPWNDHKTVA